MSRASFVAVLPLADKSSTKGVVIFPLIYNFAAFFFFVAKGRAADFISAKWHALKGLKRALEKRQQVQINKKVSDEYIWNLFEKERLLPRLSRRLFNVPDKRYKSKTKTNF